MNSEDFQRIVESARLAPSVHNTQPWKVSSSVSAISVEIDSRYALKDGDPTGRETILSMGIFCEALVLSSEAEGYAIKNIEFSNNKFTIEAVKSPGPPPEASSKKVLLSKRSTDRSLYRPVEISAEFEKNISNTAKEEGIEVRVVKNREVIALIAELTSKGIRLALSNPAFREELSRFLTLPWSRKKRGISVRSLYIAWPLEIMQPLLVRLGLSSKAEAAIEKKRWLSASCVIAILGDGDLSKYWFNAGRSYLRASLTIEDYGLAQATSAAIVEASTYHEDIEKSLHTAKRILALIRVGKGSPKRHYSPRVRAEELFT